MLKSKELVLCNSALLIRRVVRLHPRHGMSPRRVLRHAFLYVVNRLHDVQNAKDRHLLGHRL